MSSNPSIMFDDGAQRSQLAGWDVLEVAGFDAAGFLQRQTMNDVAQLSHAGSAQWNGLLNAKGRVQALFICLRLSDQRYWLISPDVPAQTVQSLLNKFVFRSKLTLIARDDVAAHGSWGATDSGMSWKSPAGELGDDGSVRIVLPGDGSTRELRLSTTKTEQQPDSDANARWRLNDLRCGLPRLSMAQMDAWTPHMLSLDRLAAFSLKKGCYPGQEIVARTHYLGRSKRGLQRLDAATAIETGIPVQNADGETVGNTICNASWHNDHTALAVNTISLQNQPLRTAAGLFLHPFDFAVA